MGVRGKGKLGALCPHPPHYVHCFLFSALPQKVGNFVCHYHLTQRVMSRVFFRFKVLFLLCCCRKYPYYSIKVVLV